MITPPLTRPASQRATNFVGFPKSTATDKVHDKVYDKVSAASGSLLVLIVALIAFPTFAQVPASEEAAFKAASRSFQIGAYDRARKEFTEFLNNFPQSSKVPEAVLLEAITAVKLKDHQQAATLLSSNLPRAGVFTEQYRYWLGEANLQGSNYVAAADSFAQLVRDFPESAHLLEAAYGEALARFRLKEWSRVSALLQTESGVFQKIARARPEEDLIVRGLLLLAEALMAQKQWSAAEAVLNNMNTTSAAAELKWQWQNLLCRIALAEKKWQSALAASSNLVSFAEAGPSPVLRAEAIILQAGILQQLNRSSEAAAVYQQNLRKEIPPERRREAFLKVVELTLAEQSLEDAVAKLERLLSDHSADPGSDVARLALGELRLKQSSSGAPLTNALQSALLQFDELLKNSPQSPLAGKAQLDRGWCFWQSDRIGDSAAAFKAAATQLPHGEDQAVARFKLGDALLVANDFSNALQNFHAVLSDYDDLPAVKQSLIPHALYHSLRCHIELSNVIEAGKTMRQILDSYAESPFADRSLLMFGQQLSASGQAMAARRLFADFGKRFPGSALLPQVELALARSHTQEKNWDAAISQYDQWIGRYPTNDLRPQAEFNRGWACFQAGRDTNALVVFTNFVAEFPTNELAPLALRWVADFYYRQSDFENAERNYQLLFQSTNWPVTDITWEARMLAGRAAFARQSYKNAAEYFRSLLNDNNCPTNLLAEAWFALGDTMLLQDPDSGKTRSQKFAEALAVFKKIPDQHPTSPLVPRAWGEIANCYLQMAAVEAKYYDNAKEAYQKILNDSDVSTRSQAEIGLGAVLEKQARSSGAADPEQLLDSASDHYLNVLLGKTSGDEQGDIFWMKKAGLEAARLAEERKQWEAAINVYNNLSSVIPSARKVFQRKIDRIHDQLRGESK